MHDDHDESEPEETIEADEYVDREAGVFPGAIQPEKLVLVIDEASEYVDIPALKRRGYSIISGKNIDMPSMLELIHKHSSYKVDGVLYAIVPGLSFFLKHMKAFTLELPTEKEDVCIENVNDNVNDILFSSVSDFCEYVGEEEMKILSDNDEYREDCILNESDWGTRLMVQYLVQSALTLRSSVRDSSLNCDVVFAGFPVHLMSAEKLKEIYSEVVSFKL